MLALACSLFLPTTWIVDAQMGQGAHFADLPAAIAAAANGDTIVLRAGTYTGAFLSNKELTLRGDGADVTHVVGAFGGVGLNISNTPGPVVVSGLRLQGGPGVHVFDAEVELLDCEVVGKFSTAGAFGASGLYVNSGGSVRASRCSFLGGGIDASALLTPVTGGPAVRVIGLAPSLVADQCLLRGGDGTGPESLTQTGGDALEVTGRVRLDRCRLRGGTGNDVAGIGIRASQGAELRVAGDATSYVSGGFGPDGVGRAIVNQASTVRLHLPVAVQGAIDGFVPLHHELPRLQVDGALRADGSFEALQPVTVTLNGHGPHCLGFVAFGAPQFQPAQIPFATELLLDEFTCFFLFAPLDAAGMLQFSYTPAAIGSFLVGLPVHLQGGAMVPWVGWALTSNCDVHVARP